MEEFNISEFIKYYISYIFVVILLMAVAGLICWYYTSNVQVPFYQSQTSLVLTRSSESNMITSSDISLNKNLVSTYREIIKSRRILSRVIENLDLDITEAELSDSINVSSANETELIIISVTNKNKTRAYRIANEIAEVFKEEITEIYKIENISIVDKAVEAENAYNIKPLKQYTIFIGAGFLIGTLIITIHFYFDNSIKKAEDIEEKIGLSVLSTVPKYKKKKK